MQLTVISDIDSIGFWGSDLAKSLKFFSIILLLFSGTGSAAEKLDEATARTLIVRQLLTLVEGHAPSADKSNVYQLCTYRDSNAHSQMVKHLASVMVQGLTLKITDKKKRSSVSTCNALYINQPDQNDLEWFKENQVNQNTLVIINGRNYVKQGFHIGLFLNNRDTFDFELNPQAFESSRFTPRKELLQFGQVIESELQKRIKLLRNLINFTDWPPADSEFNTSDSFNLCFYKNKSLSTFVDYFSRRKTFKSKSLVSSAIDSVEQATSCDAVILDDTNSGGFYRFVAERDTDKKLLVGNSMKTSASGVHYNLAEKKSTGRLFEINLIAFEQTGHSPHFELINSAKLVNRDFPEVARMLNLVVQSTTWSAKNSALKKVEVCVYQQPNLASQLTSIFAVGNKNTGDNLKGVSFKNIEKSADLDTCLAILSNQENWKQIDAEQSAQTGSSISGLRIMIGKKRVSAPNIHYQLLIAPKRINLEVNKGLLNSNGFTISQSMFELGELQGGDQ